MLDALLIELFLELTTIPPEFLCVTPAPPGDPSLIEKRLVSVCFLSPHKLQGCSYKYEAPPR